jgi:aspartate aminotransferase-like enzyme
MKRANFSTGPVAISPRVRRALAAPAVSHRSVAFVSQLHDVRAMLTALTGAQHVAVACGSGTLANEMIAQQLRCLPKRGLILANGEFGERLCQLATRAGLAFDVMSAPWGTAVDLSAVDAQLTAGGDYSWLWCVAVETSTGVRTDLTALADVTRKRGVRLCVDCMSAIGAMPLDLSNVYLASASSGKALASVAGLAMVFAHSSASRESLSDTPASLDLALHLRGDGVPHTVPSTLVAALHASLQTIVAFTAQRYATIARDNAALTKALRTIGLSPLINDDIAAPSVITVPIPASAHSFAIGAYLRDRGIDVGFESAYLRQRNWIQLALMGEYSKRALRQLPQQIDTAIRETAALAATNSALDDAPRALANLSFAE